MSITPILSIMVAASLLAAGSLGQPAISAEPVAPAPAATTLAGSFIDTNGPADLETKIRSLSENTNAGSETRTAELVGIARGITADSKLPLAHEAAFTLETEAGYTMLRIPFEASADVLPESGVSVYFDNNSKIISVGEIVLTEVTEDSGTVQFWQDGVKTTDRLITEPRPVVSGTTAQAAGFNWGTFNDCLASAGIASWAITAIGIACGAACAVTAGIGCIVCATATAGIAGTTIGNCAGKAML